jgi:hypothetical protein
MEIFFCEDSQRFLDQAMILLRGGCCCGEKLARPVLVLSIT